MEVLKVDRTKLYTPTAYARKVDESVQLIKKWMNNGRLETVKINGHTLVYANLPQYFFYPKTFKN